MQIYLIFLNNGSLKWIKQMWEETRYPDKKKKNKFQQFYYITGQYKKIASFDNFK